MTAFCFRWKTLKLAILRRFILWTAKLIDKTQKTALARLYGAVSAL